MKIIKGDNVKVLIGKDKGREGEVLKASPKTHTLIVKGLNLFKKHVRPTQNTKGGIIEKERELAVSKVALICPNCKKAARVSYQLDKSGDKFRVCSKCKSVISVKSK